MDAPKSKEFDNAKLPEVGETAVGPQANPFAHVDDGLYQTSEDSTGVEASMTRSNTVTQLETQTLPAAASYKPRSSAKVSRYTTGYLTTSGWLPIDKHVWPVESHKALADIEPRAIPERSTATTPALVEYGEESTEIFIRQNEEAMSRPFIDDKYFEYHGYLDYLSSMSKLDEHPQPMDSTATICDDTTSVSSDSDVQIVEISSITSGMDTLAVHTPTTERNATPNLPPSSPPSTASTIPDDNINEEDANDCTVHDNNITSSLSLGGGPVDITASKPVLRKAQNVFVPEEDEWLLLFHKKVKGTVEAGFRIKMPGPISVLHAFNEFFEGKALQNESGHTLPPRQRRDINSMRGKLFRKDNKVWKLRTVTRKLLEGSHGGSLYVPIIAEEDLQEYCAFGSFETDDPTDATKNAALKSSVEVSKRFPSKRKLEDTDMDTGPRDSKRLEVI